MSTEAIIALLALVFGTATAAVAIVDHELNASLAALDPQSFPGAVCAQDWLAGYDTGSVIYRGQMAQPCILSHKQQSRS
jgi:hypothetical protein